MGHAPRPLLERHRVFHSRDADELRAFLGRIAFRLDLPPRRARELDARLNGVYFPGIFVGYVQYEAPVVVRATPERDDYWLHLPVRGRMEVTHGRDRVACHPRLAGVASPTRRDYYELSSEAGSAAIRVRMLKSFVCAQLSALLGQPVDRAPEFFPSLDLTRGHGVSLGGYLRMAVADLEHGDSVLANPSVAAELEQFLANGLLMGHPHSYSDALRGVDKAIAPRDVKRAIDFVQANLDLPITIADIARAAGVPGRTLFKHFRDCRGVSPMRFVRSARLERAREALSFADEGTSVTDVALQCGVGHLGRFSVEYRKRFGESPSATLRRRRNARRAGAGR